MSAPDSTIPLKKCSKCGQEKPFTPEYFHRDTRNKSGLRCTCVECHKKQKHDNRDEINRINREYRQRYREKYLMSRRAYRLKNREVINAQGREYRRRNREKVSAYDRMYNQSNPHIRKASYQRRQARKRELPNTFTGKDWLTCLEYFHYCCAICGSQLRDLFGEVEPHADHWIPLDYKGADNPGTVPENIICLCGDCNRSKSCKSPEEWLHMRFNNRKLSKILKRIGAYFEWIISERK